MRNCLLFLRFVAGRNINDHNLDWQRWKKTISWHSYKFFTDLGFETIYKHEYEYFIKVESILKNHPGEFPLFFLLSTFTRCYLKLLRGNGGIQKLHLFVKDLSRVAFWKYRYRVKRKLSLEVKLFETLDIDRIEEGSQI